MFEGNTYPENERRVKLLLVSPEDAPSLFPPGTDHLPSKAVGIFDMPGSLNAAVGLYPWSFLVSRARQGVFGWMLLRFSEEGIMNS